MQKLAAGARITNLDVGVMMLQNTLPRPAGDVGNARTFPYPVAYDVIDEAETTRVVEDKAVGLLGNALTTGRRLVALGVGAVATCCGFLAIYQRELAEHLDVPVATSSLLQIPLVLQTLRPDQSVAVLTVNGGTLTREHLRAVGVDERQLARVRIFGLEGTEHFYPMIIGKITELDIHRACTEVVDAASRAVRQDNTIGAFVFECTNLPPYAGAVRRATGLPVWDATSLINWLQSGVTADDPWSTASEAPEGR
jgi:hypothetical protein